MEDLDILSLRAELADLSKIITTQNIELQLIRAENMQIEEELNDFDKHLVHTGNNASNASEYIKEVLNKYFTNRKNDIYSYTANAESYREWTIKVTDEQNRMAKEKPNKINLDPKIINQWFDIHRFDETPLYSVLEAIERKNIIEGVNIAEKIKDPLFRFVTIENTELSYKISTVISIIYKDARTLNPDVAELGRQKNRENADEFAKKMRDVVTTIQLQEKISSYRETVKALNEKHIPTYRGGEWHIKTLQDLNKRWKELGLMSHATKPK